MTTARTPSSEEAVLTVYPIDRSRRSFLKTTVALAGTGPLPAALLQARAGEGSAPLLAYVVLVAAYHPRLRWPAFNRIGDYSYGMYVYSFPLQQTLMQRFPALEPAGLFALSLPLSLAVAACSWHALERPALALKSRFNRPRKSP